MGTTLDNLREDISGAIIEPDHAEYDAVSGTVLAAGRPTLVAKPANTVDVQTVVTYARESGQALAVRGGGHSFAGFGTNEDGVVIDLSFLNTVEVINRDWHVVRIGGGATWGHVADALAPYRLAISSGDTRSVGVGGLTLSGGIGWKVRKYGLALDQLAAVEMVTASGAIVRASEAENPDLFWAIRGGGGNFGVVTAFEFVAHRTTDVFFGKIEFPVSEAATVLTGWAEYVRNAPEELTSIANVMFGSDASLHIEVAYDGDDPDLAANAIDPVRRLGTVIVDDVALRPYRDVLVEGMIPPPGIQFLVHSGFVNPASVDDALRILTEIDTSTPLMMAMRSVGGAVSRVSDDATAYAHRQAELMCVTAAVGPKPVVDAVRPALDAIWRNLEPHVAGAYGNFLDSATGDDVAEIFPEQTYKRLAAVKRLYDAGNLFAGNHNVRPE